MASKKNKKEKKILPVYNLPDHQLEHEPFDFRQSAGWRMFRIMSEFVEGFEFLVPLKKEITIFGSTRTKSDDQYYKMAVKLGRLLAKNGFTVITGGGPGIMEAGNRGAFEEGGESIGLNIQLPQAQRINPYVKKSISFHYFFTRKVMLSVSAQAYIFFPGGFGTLDELFEMVTLIQTKKIMVYMPVILVGREYWRGLLAWLKEEVLKKHKNISEEEFSLITLVDSAEEAFEIIKKTSERLMFT